MLHKNVAKNNKSIEDVNNDLMKLKSILSMTISNNHMQDKAYNEYKEFIKEIKEMIEL